MATSLKHEDFHKNLECPICLSFFKEPKILICSHTFCKGCLETLLESRGELLCPTCREETLVPGGEVGRLQSNITVRSLVEDVETQGQFGSNSNQEKQIDEVKKVLDLVKDGPNIPLQTEALIAHEAMCQQLEELLNRIGPIAELPRRTAEEGERIGFRSQGSDGLRLGQPTHTREVLAHTKSKWVLRKEARPPARKAIRGMVISRNNEMAVGCRNGGIFIYSSDGIIQDTVLKSVEVNALYFMPDGGYVIRDTQNTISLYTELCEKLDVTFETQGYAQGGNGGLTVGKDGLIFIGYNAFMKIQVFKPEGGKAIREIIRKGFVPWQMFAMTHSQTIVVKGGCRKVHVINDVSGAIIHSICKEDVDYPYPAVCQDDSVIIAWVKHGQGLLSIVKYTKKLKYIKNILTEFKITKSHDGGFLQTFKTGEIAFCTNDSLYIFHETWE